MALALLNAVLRRLDAAVEGYETGGLQLLVTSFARLAVLVEIQGAAQTHGDSHPDVAAARALFDQAGAVLAAGDYLDAIEVYEDAFKALP